MNQDQKGGGLDRRFVLTAGGLWLAAGGASAQTTGPVVETTAGRVRGTAGGRKRLAPPVDAP